MALKTDYKDDILDSSVNVNRTFSIIDNTTGLTIYPNVSLEETTVFSQEGDSHTAQITNEQNAEINQINASLSELEGKIGMPSLDYANYLHVFSTTAPTGMPSGASYGLTFTATKDCYLLGYANSPAGDNKFTTIKINNTQVYAVEGYHDYVSDHNQIGIIPCTKLTSGDTVVVSSAQATLFIFAEK